MISYRAADQMPNHKDGQYARRHERRSSNYGSDREPPDPAYPVPTGTTSPNPSAKTHQ
jgi:hypothetical protein